MIKNVIFDVGRVLAAYDYQSYLNRKNYSEEEQKIIKKAMFESQNMAFGRSRRGTGRETLGIVW